MTKYELLQRLKEIDKTSGEDWDFEKAHVQADNALLEYINDTAIKEAFDAIEKWYD